jgi:hypothetical protein
LKIKEAKLKILNSKNIGKEGHKNKNLVEK